MSTDVAVGNEPEATIQTSACEAYTHMPGSDDYVNPGGKSAGTGNGHRGTYICRYAYVVNAHSKLHFCLV